MSRLITIMCVTAALAIGLAGVRPRAVPLRSFEAVLLEKTADTTANASIGDVNGDGRLDIVLAKGRHWPAHDVVLLGDGKGHFSPPVVLPNPADRSYSARLADLTKSGRLDIVLSNDAPDPKRILLNDGKGHFTNFGTFGDSTWETRNVSVHDLDGDGYPDIAVANRPGPAQVCFNDHHAHFACRVLGPETSATNIIADIDGDGARDIVVACRDECQSVIYFGDGKGGFSHKLAFGPAKSSTRALAVADLNGDGRLDIVAAHEDAGVFVYFNSGGSPTPAGVQIAGLDALPYSMTTADLNRDGKADILLGYVEAPGVVFFNDGSGLHYQRVLFGDAKGVTYGMAVADLDGDGFLDIVAARSDAPSLLLFNRASKR